METAVEGRKVLEHATIGRCLELAIKRGKYDMKRYVETRDELIIHSKDGKRIITINYNNGLNDCTMIISRDNF